MSAPFFPPINVYAFGVSSKTNILTPSRNIYTTRQIEIQWNMNSINNTF